VTKRRSTKKKTVKKVETPAQKRRRISGALRAL
jgi:hypothetical protein